jgi:hypothetical protein
MTDDLEFGPAFHRRQDLVHSSKDLVLDQILGKYRTLNDGKALENHDDGRFADLEGQIRRRRSELCTANRSSHGLGLLVLESFSRSPASRRSAVTMRTVSRSTSTVTSTCNASVPARPRTK